MKLAMTSVLALSMMVASAFAAANQDAPKPATADAKVTTPKVKKHKKAVKSTSAVATPVAKPAATPSK